MSLVSPRRSWAVAVAMLSLAAAAASAQEPVGLSCLPDKAVALPGDTVLVNTWVASAAGAVTANVGARWRVSAGSIDRQEAAARWSLEGAPVESRHTAEVDVTVGGVPVGSCSLGVWLAAPATAGAAPGDPAGGVRLRGEYITRRAFLRGDQAGEAGFGLYSYFLMREPSSAADRARATSFVAAFLDVLLGVADQENYVERRRLNGSYLPTTADPPRGLVANERAAWALEHYDYEHAKAFLSLYPMLTGPGPFIVAVPAPLRSPVKPMLPWDFSQIDNAAIADAVSRFLNQAAQLYDWQNQSALQKLREQLLTAVAGMFVGRSAAENWMQIVR
jgi:hypothetical protein